MNRATWGSALFAVVLLAGCTSSSKPDPGPGSLTPSMTTPPASAPSSPSRTPSPSPTKSKPLSSFETDAGVIALRKWAAEAARTVNSGRFDSPALDALMTKAVAAEMKQTFGSDVGLHYPGPLPFLPLAVSVPNATTRSIKACFVGAGFAETPGTNKPAAKLTLVPVLATEQMSSGVWLLARQNATTVFSCSGVKVPMPR